MPEYFKQYPVYYAGPAKTPEGYASGSFGPTTAGRMDAFVNKFQAAGGSMVMLAKGNRSKMVVQACKKHGGFIWEVLVDLRQGWPRIVLKMLKL